MSIDSEYTGGDCRDSSSRKYDLKQLMELFHYHPVESKTQKIDLHIDWSSVKQQKLGQAFSTFDAIILDPEKVTDDARAQESVLYHGPIKRLGFPELDLEIKKVMANDPENPSELLRLSISNASAPETREIAVADFMFRLHRTDAADVWDMEHRVVYEGYREQQIASRVLEMVEDQCTKRVKEYGKMQEIVVDCGQADVLFWLLNKGYEPAEPIDQEHLIRLLAGDDSLAIVSPTVAEKTSSSKQWYLFEKDAILHEDGLQKEEVWTERSETGKPRYTTEAFRIRVKKVFE